MVTDSKFGKTICSICYEDLKPIVEDLQAISICGHVFHELCLQQWFEYCKGTKKCTCPVCKQSCSAKNVGRLYFQSVGDQTDPLVSPSLKDQDVEDPVVLRGEVKKLEIKVSRLTSDLEHQGKELRGINEELCICKERMVEEVALKNEALRQKAFLQQLLQSKSQELDNVTSECTRLEGRNMALAKELAALKLVSDMNLDEDEILKFASLGNEANNKDTVDILRKSLVIRNKNYTELISKCNLLGRENARSCQKLEKAKDKINKLKLRIQELETAVEVKDNEVLRTLRTSKKATRKREILNCVDGNSTSLCNDNSLSEDQREQCPQPMNDVDCTTSLPNDTSGPTKGDGLNFAKNRDAYNANTVKKGAHKKGRYALTNEDDSKSHTPSEDKEVALHEPSSHIHIPGSRDCVNSVEGFAQTTNVDKNVILTVDDTSQDQPMLSIRKESSFPVQLPKPGDVCFSGGLLAPDGTNRYLGKWCKRGQNKGVSTMQNSTNSGDLIAVGADGRGGRVKVLRSACHSLDGKENPGSAKRLKYGTKTSSFQSQGCLQIEHFFGKASH